MTAINWNIFENLPGNPTLNFEKLCRALIQRHYGRHGCLNALANQPGVEFHLRLDADCILGDAGRWYGWQCRWYQLSSGQAIGTTRRKKIAEALAKTQRSLPDLTDWVLWTRYPLTKSDQKWFLKISTKMRVHLWTYENVEQLLCGDGEVFRSTYFGDLVLTPDLLAAKHSESVAQIRRRWMPEVHQTIGAERQIRQMLAEAEHWDDLASVARQLNTTASVISQELKKLPVSMANKTKDFVKAARAVAMALNNTHKLITKPDSAFAETRPLTTPVSPDATLVALPRQLRAARQRAGLFATNALADIRLAHELLAQVSTSLKERIVAVVADAGEGKTQLAAQLSRDAPKRPCGVLLHGKDLHAGHTLDNLARTVVLHGTLIPSMEGLVAALDAAGQRVGRRLPLVIDALNEAQDPRNWKSLLASLDEVLKRYPFVLVICTVRAGEFAEEAIPSIIRQLRISGFGPDADEAIRRYFEYYKIDPTDVPLPWEFLSHALTLRLFCEVANPTREKQVGVEAMPWSLAGLFEKYLDQVVERVADLSPHTNRYCQQDVSQALDIIGQMLWERKVRAIDMNALRAALRDDSRPWDQSIVRALEQEGVLLRDSRDESGNATLSGVYDALSGHLIAKTIVTKYGNKDFAIWLRDSTTQTALTRHDGKTHPLNEDIFRALVALVPRKLHREQLWTSLDEPMRTEALWRTAELEAAYLDGNTIKELAKMVLSPPPNVRDLLDRLWNTRGGMSHPLNATFLDSILREMDMPSRDLRWTEWVRRNEKEILHDLEMIERYWKQKPTLSTPDSLRARWIMWTLTSTVRKLRDQATRSLYWYGRGNPSALFALALDSLAISDPYVSERMLAAAYGVAMALYRDASVPGFSDEVFPGFATQLYANMFAENAALATTHALARDYARHTLELALICKPRLLDARQVQRIRPPFSDGGIRQWGTENPLGKEFEFGFRGPIHMDFGNYTLGRLVPDRANYDSRNSEYRDVISNVSWRMSQLGYSQDKFDQVDRNIGSERYSPHRIHGNDGRVDRYGKKYSWIAYYELFGFRHDLGKLKSRYGDDDGRPTDVDIDPSFPDEPTAAQVLQSDWLGNRNQPLETWIDRGTRPEVKPQLVVKEINKTPGPWILLNGFIKQTDDDHHRALFAFARGFCVRRRDSAELVKHLSARGALRHELNDLPSDHYTFAGEIPWSDTFPKNGMTDLELKVGMKRRKESRNNVLFFRGRKLLDDQESQLLVRRLVGNPGEERSDQAIAEMLKAESVDMKVVKEVEYKEEPINKTFSVLIPVRQSCWESYHSGLNPGQNAPVPTREICESLRLSLQLPTWNLRDSKGGLASFTVSDGDLWKNGNQFCYLRRDLLNEFLAKRQFRLIWIFWGAREIHLSREDRSVEDEKIKHWRKNFQRIYVYDNESITAKTACEWYE